MPKSFDSYLQYRQKRFTWGFDLFNPFFMSPALVKELLLPQLICGRHFDCTLASSKRGRELCSCRQRAALSSVGCPPAEGWICRILLNGRKCHRRFQASGTSITWRRAWNGCLQVSMRVRGIDRQHITYMNESVLFFLKGQTFLSCLHIRVLDEPNPTKPK